MMCSTLFNMDLYVAARAVGFLGLISSALAILRLSLEVAPPANPGRLTLLLQTDLEDLWGSGRHRTTADITTDMNIIANYILFMLFNAVSNTLLILATYLKRRWGLMLWLLVETTKLMWQLNFLAAGTQPARYAPGVLDFATTSLNLVTGLYLCARTTPTAQNNC